MSQGMLTPHFSLAELTATQHRGIDNTPDLAALGCLRQTALLLEQVRTRLAVPIIVTSGYRCALLNAAVGGQRKSQHLTGQAADFIAPGFGSPSAIVIVLKDSGIEFDQIICEFGRWVHISFSAKPRGHVLVIDATGTRPFMA